MAAGALLCHVMAAHANHARALEPAVAFTDTASIQSPIVPRIVSRPMVALILLSSLTFGVGLGRTALTDSDEAYYAEGAREMVESGDWLTPHFNDVYRFEKPILYYWLAATASLPFGASEAAARLPSALAGAGLVLVTFVCARRRYDLPTATLAGAIGATSFGYVAVARQALPDLALAFFVVLATWAGIGALIDPSVPLRQRRRWMILCAAAAAGAFLTKGPVGVALPAIVVVPLMAWSYGVTWRRWRHAMPLVTVGAATFLILGTPWYLAMMAEHGPAYLERFFITENVDRFATDRYNDPRPLWYYLPIVAGGLLPWTPFTVLWLDPLRRLITRTRRLTATEVHLAVWAAAPLVFYTASVGKQPRYILPMLPPLAILLARALHARVSRETPRAAAATDPLLVAAGAAAGVLIAAAGILVYHVQALLGAWSVWQTTAALSVIIVSAVAVIVAALRQPRRWLVPAIVGATVTTTLALQYSVLSPGRPEPVEQMAEMLREARHGGEPYGRYRVFTRNLVFYTGVPHVDLITDEQVIRFLRSSDRVLCVMTRRDLERVTAAADLTILELGEVSYVNLGDLKLRTVLSPNPVEDVQWVVLVANK